MIELVATTARTVTVNGRRYTADAGATILADPRDLDRLAGFGLEPAPPPAADEATLGDLRERAKAAGIRGRTTMDREELLEALRTAPDGQEA